MERPGWSGYNRKLGAFGNGLGAALLEGADAAFPDAFAMGFDVIEGNARTIGFYQRSGFAAPGAPEGELRHAKTTRAPDLLRE